MENLKTLFGLRRNLVNFLILILAVVALPVGVNLVRSEQIISSRASSDSIKIIEDGVVVKQRNGQLVAIAQAGRTTLNLQLSSPLGPAQTALLPKNLIPKAYAQGDVEYLYQPDETQGETASYTEITGSGQDDLAASPVVSPDQTFASLNDSVQFVNGNVPNSCPGYPESCTTEDGQSGQHYCSPGKILDSGECGYDPVNPPSCSDCQVSSSGYTYAPNQPANPPAGFKFGLGGDGINCDPNSFNIGTWKLEQAFPCTPDGHRASGLYSCQGQTHYSNVANSDTTSCNPTSGGGQQPSTTTTPQNNTGSSCSGYPESCTTPDGQSGQHYCSPGKVLDNGACSYDPANPPSCSQCQPLGRPTESNPQGGISSSSCPYPGDTCSYSTADGKCYSGHGVNGFNTSGCQYSCGPIACPGQLGGSSQSGNGQGCDPNGDIVPPGYPNSWTFVPGSIGSDHLSCDPSNPGNKGQKWSCKGTVKFAFDSSDIQDCKVACNPNGGIVPPGNPDSWTFVGDNVCDPSNPGNSGQKWTCRGVDKWSYDKPDPRCSGFSPTPSASSQGNNLISNNPLTNPQVTTVSVQISEDPGSLNSASTQPYTGDGMVVSYVLSNNQLGPKTIYVKFIPSSGQAAIRSVSIPLVEADAAISAVSCKVDITGNKITFDLVGSNFGPSTGKLSTSLGDLAVNQWGENAIDATLNNPSTTNLNNQAINLKLTRADGLSVDGPACSSSLSDIVVQTAPGCPSVSTLSSSGSLSGVEYTAVDDSGNKDQETVSIDSNGLIQGLKTKLTTGKKYTVTLKAPYSLRKTVQFTASGGTQITKFNLPLGNIFPPSTKGDNTVNTFDYSELKSEWGLDQSGNKPGDIDHDGVVNSLDWACMRLFMGQSDDPIPQGSGSSTQSGGGQ